MAPPARWARPDQSQDEDDEFPLLGGNTNLLPLPLNVVHELQKFRPGGPELLPVRPTLTAPVDAEIPVWLLRWTHDSINSKMEFGSGRQAECSIYSMVHDFLCGRLLPSDIPPLQVVLDGTIMYSLSNRRLAALKMFQALCLHSVVKVPCQVWHPKNEKIRSKYIASKTTTSRLGDGIGLELRGDAQEAWHMGQPLFRRPQEWCDAPGTNNLSQVSCKGQRPVGVIKDPVVRMESAAPIEGQTRTSINFIEKGEVIGKSSCVTPMLASCRTSSRIAEHSNNHQPPQNCCRPPSAPPSYHPQLVPPSSFEETLPPPAQPPSKPPTLPPDFVPTNPLTSQEATTPPQPSTPVSREPGEHVSSMFEHTNVGSDSEKSFREDSEDDVYLSADNDDTEVQAKCATDSEFQPSSEHANIEELENELKEQSQVLSIKDLKGRLICGTFRVSSGSDFKNRRSRGHVLVERGPEAMAGCRVHIVGNMNRNRAWDFDLCWVRVLAARVEADAAPRVATEHRRAQHDVDRKWDAADAEATVIFGNIVAAREQGSPRQRLVLCMRSRIVRSLKHMMFRAINGKFPLIKVPWNSQRDTPHLHDLHVIEIVRWKNELPIGQYVERMNMDQRETDQEIIYAIKRSLNLTDWEVHSDVPQRIVPSNEMFAYASKSMRQDLRHVGAISLCIQHDGWPTCMAFSMPCPSEVHVHIIDVTAYLALEAHGEGLESQARNRGCGVWLTDYLDQPCAASLPLLQEEFSSRISFAERQDRLAITFVLKVNLANGGIDLPSSTKSDHFESEVRCDYCLTYLEAQLAIAGESSSESSSAATELLQTLSKLTAEVEQKAFDDGRSFAFEHWDPKVGLEQIDSAATVDARRIVGCLSFLVNFYASQVLIDAQIWKDLCSEEANDSEPVCSGGCLVPMWVYCRPDQEHHRSLQRLFQNQTSCTSAGDSTTNVLKALKAAVCHERLTVEQRFAVQKAYLRQVRQCLPEGVYKLCEEPMWPSRGSQRHKKAPFFRRPSLFHVSAPLCRYMDIMGQRALKWARGWRPGNFTWLRPTLAHMQETVDRTNARIDALRVARLIQRQISLMRKLESASLKITNAVVGFVGPSQFQVIVPVPSSVPVSFQVPTSALRSSTCSLEFVAERQTLKVLHVDAWEGRSGRSEWHIRPWGWTRVGCTISRNFAQPVKHHATPNSMIVSVITFPTNTRPDPISFSIGHKMYPELFSEHPDLKDMHMMEKSIGSYSATWYSVWRCRTHAAAAMGTASPAMRPLCLEFKEESFTCDIVPPGCMADSLHIEPGDLAILHCYAKKEEEDQEVLLYGEVHGCKPAKHQYKRKKCTKIRCSRKDCPFVHDGEETEQPLFHLGVQLSEISRLAFKAQREVLNFTQEAIGSAGFRLQIVAIPVQDRRNLDLVKQLPKLCQSRSKASPVVGYLTRIQAPMQKQNDVEMRPLANIHQVDQAINKGQYSVKSSPLNDIQLTGLKRGLQYPFSIVQGPPGTGKTTFLIHLTTALANLEQDTSLPRFQSVNGKRQRQVILPAQESLGRILVCTPSNQAADECLRRLVDETTVPPHFITRVYARAIEYNCGSKLRGGSGHYNSFHSDFARTEHKVRDDLEEHSLHYKARHAKEVLAREVQLRDEAKTSQKDYDSAYLKAEQRLLQKSRIVITTCSSAVSHGAFMGSNKGNEKGCPDVVYRTVIVDECAQATEPEVVLPLLLAQDRAIIVGDHKQLGPVVTEHNLCKAYMVLLEKPMLERLENKHGAMPCSTMLETQYRMHSTICSFPSKHFYSSKLQSVNNMHVLPVAKSIWPNPRERVMWIDCRHPQQMGQVCQVGQCGSLATSVLENNISLQNKGETRLIVAVYSKLLRSGHCKAEDIAIITPYRAQQQHIRQKLSELPGTLGEHANRTAVGTVFSMQGSERHFILLSFVRSISDSSTLQDLSMVPSTADICVAVRDDNPALRQTFESHLGIAAKPTLLNVALTRAKSGLVIVGNRKVLSEGSDDFFRLAVDIEGRGGMLSEDHLPP